MSIAALLEAAEYLERRDRGMFVHSLFYTQGCQQMRPKVCERVMILEELSYYRVTLSSKGNFDRKYT